MILKELENFAQKDIDESLLDEIVYLLEMPTVLKGSFDNKYLDIPENFFWNIFPSENKKVFSPYYIKENKLIIMTLQLNSIIQILTTCLEAKNLEYKRVRRKKFSVTLFLHFLKI